MIGRVKSAQNRQIHYIWVKIFQGFILVLSQVVKKYSLMRGHWHNCLANAPICWLLQWKVLVLHEQLTTSLTHRVSWKSVASVTTATNRKVMIGKHLLLKQQQHSQSVYYNHVLCHLQTGDGKWQRTSVKYSVP